jgi:N-acetylglucosaminyldiphosphoundecaprenol N-acetyl-beta-D-mannosaminyltransferase
MTSAGPSRRRVRLGRIFADDLTFDGALDACVHLARSGRGGFVVTPNVDHVVLAEHDPALLAAYDEAALSLVDGMPLLWLARLGRTPLPEKISGSDLAEPLAARAAAEGLSVYFLGARQGVGQRAADALVARHPGLEVAGVYSPPLGFEKDPEATADVIARVADAAPAFVFVALGCPKQELFMHQHFREMAPAVLLGIGATLDFLAGEVRRAPAVLSRLGLEWAYRLAKEPRRMASRYLGRDLEIAPIAVRSLLRPRAERVFFTPTDAP